MTSYTTAERGMSVKKYHVVAGDGKGYYGVGYESRIEAEELLKISQSHDPQAHIVEEEYHFTNADRIRSMSDEELEEFLESTHTNMAIKLGGEYIVRAKEYIGIWLKQPAEGG